MSREAARDNGAGPNNGIMTNLHPLQDGNTKTQPDVVLDHDILGWVDPLAGRQINDAMDVTVVYEYLTGKHAVLTDDDAAGLVQADLCVLRSRVLSDTQGTVIIQATVDALQDATRTYIDDAIISSNRQLGLGHPDSLADSDNIIIPLDGNDRVAENAICNFKDISNAQIRCSGLCRSSGLHGRLFRLIKTIKHES